MKKVLLTFCIGVILAMTACGPSAKEIEEKRIADSTRVADSLTMVQIAQTRIADSIARVQADSLKADSIANACKHTKCKKEGK